MRERIMSTMDGNSAAGATCNPQTLPTLVFLLRYGNLFIDTRAYSFRTPHGGSNGQTGRLCFVLCDFFSLYVPNSRSVLTRSTWYDKLTLGL